MVWVLILTGLLVGCGQKGPLYREAPAQADTGNPAAEAPQAEDDESSQRR